MSDTPQTDAADLEAHIGVTSFDDADIAKAYDFARQLERELNQWKKVADALAEDLTDQLLGEYGYTSISDALNDYNKLKNDPQP